MLRKFFWFCEMCTGKFKELAPTMFEEYLVWLAVICAGLAIFHYWAFYLVFLWTVYFFAVRLLERIQLGDLQTKAVLISGCDSGRLV